MRMFSDYNPIVIAIYFLATAGISMFCMNPILLFLSFFGALLFFFVKNGKRHGKSHGMLVILLFCMALINPLVSHNGVTVLFVLNDAPVTAEAVLYGIVASVMILAVLYWFRSFTQIMTSDKLLYLFGKLSPKLSLILSMGLRYVPLFHKQAKKIHQTQTALGLYKEDNIVDKTKGSLRIFSIMVTWALENGIVTADSMTARGYGIGKRSHFSIFHFQKADVVLLLITFVLCLLTCVSIGIGALDFVFYPSIKMAVCTPLAIMGYVSYGILILFPTFIEVEEKIKWKYLKSKI